LGPDHWKLSNSYDSKTNQVTTQTGNEQGMRKINVAILGCGTVGTGVARLLLDNGVLLQDRVGCAVALKYVADIDTETDRGITFQPGVMIPDASTAINDLTVDIVVETIGGEGIAKQLILDAIAKGKHVVTANKALLAKHGNDIIGQGGQESCGSGI
jgi:homoserine dehydrogenase